MPEQDTFREWCVVELLGHRRLGALVTEATIAGAPMLRLDVPATPGNAAMTQYVAPGALYALTPTTKELATALAARCRPEPVSRFEIAPMPSPRVQPEEYYEPDDPDSWTSGGPS